jgi:hypothetical protein
MLARGVPAVRVCVFDVAPERIAEYLEAVAWPGARDTAAQYADMLAGYADFLGLHLDVGEVNFPTLGIEPGFTAGPWARQPHLEPRWHGQLDALVRCGLCTDEKRRALLDWVGYQPCPEPELAGSVLLRGLSHLKVAIGLDGRPAAKAYFGLALRGPKSSSSSVTSELDP